MKIMESIEEHPYIAAGGVFVLGVILIIILFSGGSKTPAVVQSPQSDTSAATQYAMAQLQSQTALGVAQIQAGKSANDNAAMVQAVQIQAATTQNHDLQQYNTTVAAGLINKDIAIGTSTIQAQYMAHNSDNMLAASLADTAATREVNLSAIDAQRSIGMATVAGQTQIGLATVAGQVQVAQWGNQTAQLQSNNALAAALAATAAGVTISNNTLAATKNTNATAASIAANNNQTQLYLDQSKNFRTWNAGQLHLDDNRTSIALAQFNH